MQRARNVADVLDGGAQKLPHFRQSVRAVVAPNFICRRSKLKTRRRESLTNGVVQLARNLSAFPFLGVNHFRAELPHPLAAGSESVEHLVDRRRKLAQLAVRHNGGWN